MPRPLGPTVATLALALAGSGCAGSPSASPAPTTDPTLLEPSRRSEAASPPAARDLSAQGAVAQGPSSQGAKTSLPQEATANAPARIPSTPMATPPVETPPTSVSLASLRADPRYATHLDLLDEALAALSALAVQTTADHALRLTRHAGLEASARARVGRGTAFAVLTTWVEAGGDASAIRTAFLDVGRVPEWTGRAGTSLLERRGDETMARSDGVRRFLGASVGARWRFVARAVNAGDVRGVVTRQVPHEETTGMLETRGLMLAVPDGGTVRVVEVSASVLDVSVPAPLEALASSAALSELRARAQGIRTHWRDYLEASRADR